MTFLFTMGKYNIYITQLKVILFIAEYRRKIEHRKNNDIFSKQVEHQWVAQRSEK